MIDGLADLEQRLTELDGEQYEPETKGSDLAHFITVIELSISPQTRDINIKLCVSAADADALVGTSRLMQRLLNTVPEIVTGPLRVNAQYWVGTGSMGCQPAGESPLSEARFIGASDASPGMASAKPFDVGLFTSTGALGTYGMWRTYLGLHENSSLHPRPWNTWAVEPRPGVIIREITSACDWVEFVLAHPMRHGDLLFPDWQAVVRKYDAVHMTLRAIAATQGLHFPTDQGIVATGYWDVESTLWLRWCFKDVRLVETVGPAEPSLRIDSTAPQTSQ